MDIDCTPIRRCCCRLWRWCHLYHVEHLLHHVHYCWRILLDRFCHGYADWKERAQCKNFRAYVAVNVSAEWKTPEWKLDHSGVSFQVVDAMEG